MKNYYVILAMCLALVAVACPPTDNSTGGGNTNGGSNNGGSNNGGSNDGGGNTGGGNTLLFTLTSSAANEGFNPGGTIPTEFGRAQGATSGNYSFPKLTWTNVPSTAQSLLLVFQDNDFKSWKHGIWVIATSVTEIPKTAGSPSQPTPHARISTITGVDAIEPYYAPTPPSRHTYTFKLYATTHTEAALKTAVNVNAVVQDADVDGAADNADRIAAIEGILGTSIVAQSAIEGTYP